MSQTQSGYGVLVGVDGSPQSDAAVRWAAEEAVLRDLPVTLMHVIAPIVVSWPVRYLESSYSEWQAENAKHVVEQAQKTLHASSGDSTLPAVRTEVLHDGIVTEMAAASAHAAMVVIGSRGMGPVGGAVLGSVSRSLLNHAHCPITVVKADAAQPGARRSPVLLGIDGSPASEAATAFAFDEASRRGVDLVALHAWTDVGAFPILVDWHQYEDEGHEVLGERLAGWREQYPDVTVRRRIVCDRPARWLIEEARRAQMVVLGSRGRGGMRSMLLGSVSTAVAEGAAVPVTVVRG